MTPSQAAQEKLTSPRLVRVEEGPKPNYLLLDLIRDAVLMSAAHYNLFQSKPSHEKLRAIISGISDHHLFAIEREAAAATPSLSDVERAKERIQAIDHPCHDACVGDIHADCQCAAWIRQEALAALSATPPLLGVLGRLIEAASPFGSSLQLYLEALDEESVASLRDALNDARAALARLDEGSATPEQKR